MKFWKEVFRAQDEYLSNNRIYKIIQTDLINSKSPLVQQMLQWCDSNTRGSYSIAQLPEYKGYITFRFWDTEAAEDFLKEFAGVCWK